MIMSTLVDGVVRANSREMSFRRRLDSEMLLSAGVGDSMIRTGLGESTVRELRVHHGIAKFVVRFVSEFVKPKRLYMLLTARH